MKKAFWVAIETMYFSIARISFFPGTHFLGHAWVPNEQFDTNGILSIGQIRSQGTSNMILFAGFRPIFSLFRFFSPPKKYHFRTDFLRTFFYETGHLPDTKTVDNISQGISCGSRVFFG